PTDELMKWLNGFSEKLRFIHILRKEKDGSVRWQTDISDISRGLSPDEIAAYLFSHHLALGNLDKVRRCQAEDCGKFFFGRKKAKWCSNACGSRHRVSKMRKSKK
ncbi:MAG: CGNR zinc finger domain-containing protein, partial [Bdellovibrionales bacterium]|nr:CGNR zinc finger domain-containing protein [Bdellovibrionales bacterium]